VWSEQLHGGQRDCTSGQLFEDNRERPRASRCLDAHVRRMLGEMEHLRAVCEQRGASLTKIESPRVDFREQRYEICRRGALVVSGATSC
jgi:hypothetical protein